MRQREFRGAIETEFVTRHGDYVAYADRRVHDIGEAYGIVQAAFTRVLSAYSGSDNVREPTLRGLLYRAIRSEIVDRARKKSRLCFYDDIGETDDRLTVLQDHDMSPPDEQAVRNEALAHVNQAIDDLGPEHGDTVRLRYFDGLPYLDIAHELGIPEKTVSTRLWRSRQRLSGVLEDDYAVLGRRN